VPSWIERLGRDVRYAARVLARTPSFTLTAVASLALGIAVNTTMFSVVSSLLLRPLGSGGDDLVRIGRSARGERTFKTAEYEEFAYLRQHASSFTSIVGHDIASVTLSTSDESRLLSVELVAGTYFSTLGVPPKIGRAFRVEEDRVPGQAAVVVISARFRQRQFAAESLSAIVGHTLQLNGQPFTIVGVAPEGFTGTFPGVDIDLWMPAGMAFVTQTTSERGLPPSLLLTGRMAKGVSMQEAEAELHVLAGQMAGGSAERASQRSFVVGSARGALPLFANVLRVFLSMLMAVVGVVLLIACANVAGLLLARASARRREVAVRLAMGASRAQVVAQLLAESAVLALLGGVAGLLLSIWPLKLLNGLSFISGPTGAPIYLDVRLDSRVLAFTLAATLLTAIAFGLAPALQATQPGLTSALKDPRSAGTGKRARFRLGSALVVAQVCVSFVLMVGAVLLFRSLRNTDSIEVGFDPDHVFIVTVDLERLGHDRVRKERFHAELLARSRELPGVERAALSSFVPLGGTGGHPIALKVAGVTPPPGQRQLTVRVANVSDDYFATMRQALTRGREFDAADRASTQHVAIVNDAMARRYWPDSDPIGKRIGLGEGLTEHEIVGVVASARFASFGGALEPLVFLPTFNAGQLHLRTAALPADALRSVRRIAHEIDPGAVPYVSGRTMRESMASSMSLVPVKIARVVFGVAGVIALLLAAGGLFGLVSYSVEQRMKEIGIRVAMGANRQSVFRVIVGGAFRLTGVGLVVGLGIAAALMQLISSFLYGVSPTDPLTFGGIAGLLVLVTLVAGYTAARRGLSVDPMVILRYE